MFEDQIIEKKTLKSVDIAYEILSFHRNLIGLVVHVDIT